MSHYLSVFNFPTYTLGDGWWKLGVLKSAPCHDTPDVVGPDVIVLVVATTFSAWVWRVSTVWSFHESTIFGEPVWWIWCECPRNHFWMYPMYPYTNPQMPPASRPAATLHASVPRDSCPSGRQAGHGLQGNLACMISWSCFFLNREAQEEKTVGHTSDTWSQPNISPKPHCLVCWDGDSLLAARIWDEVTENQTIRFYHATKNMDNLPQSHGTQPLPIRASTSTNSTWFLRIGWTIDELLEPGQWHCMQRCDPQNVDTQSKRNKA